MFYDVTLLTGADVKTFQGSVEKELVSGEKEHSVWVCVTQTENSAVYPPHMDEDAVPSLILWIVIFADQKRA